MSVYLGESGGIELLRRGEPVSCTLEAADVDVDERRFSVDLDPDYDSTRPSPFITGDQVELKTIDGSDLELIDGMTDSAATRWVYVDQMGGIRLFDSYKKCVNGRKADAEVLITPSKDQKISIDIENVSANCVALMRSWELTTQRETVSTDILGEEYRQLYDQGMISGQGSIEAMWDYKFDSCTDDFDSGAELANYFSHLVIRFREGARFIGRFLVLCNGNESVWYDAECICTSVGLNFTTGRIISSTIQFVTTGQIHLKQGQPPGFILLESSTRADDDRDGDDLLLETSPGAIELEFGL